MRMTPRGCNYHEQFTLYTLRFDEKRLMRNAVCDIRNLQMRPTTQRPRTVGETLRALMDRESQGHVFFTFFTIGRILALDFSTISAAT